jgi:very-short-patch-repair endonuclease
MQREHIARKLSRMYSPEELGDVRILTVHQFQGSEVDILLFSTVLAAQGDGSSDYWYTKHEQILNVAVSRAKRALIIIGDQDFALASQSKLKDIAKYCLQTEASFEAVVPNRPMNIFEKQLLGLLIPIVPKNYSLQPQYVLDGRYTLDFALISKHIKIAIELDGAQHEIIGDLPVFEDGERDAYVAKHGWRVVRVPVHELLDHPETVRRHVMEALRPRTARKHK